MDGHAERDLEVEDVFEESVEGSWMSPAAQMTKPQDSAEQGVGRG